MSGLWGLGKRTLAFTAGSPQGPPESITSLVLDNATCADLTGLGDL